VKVGVVGGGVIGYAVARAAALRGAQVEIVDMRGAGLGATHASAGMLAPRLEAHGEPLLRLGLASLDLYDSYIATLRADAGLAIDYRRDGILDMRSGVVVPDQGYVKVPDLMAALQETARRLGVLVTARHVERLDRLDADAVVLAAGAWSGLFTPPAPPVKPIRGQILQLRPRQPLLSRVIWGDGVYLVPWADGAVLVGATSEDAGFDEFPDNDATRRLQEKAAQLVPGLAEATLEDVRVGLRPATPDELPLLGRSSTMRGVYYATGHYRNGVLLTPLTAALIGDLLIDGHAAPLLELVRPDRFGL
jgi:glycine oxidase